MDIIECRTQADLDAALKKKGATVRLVGEARFRVGDSAHVVAWGSAHVEAWDSAHVVAWGSAHVEARGSAHVVARGSAHVVARGNVMVRAFGGAIKAAASVVVMLHKGATAKGGQQIQATTPDSPKAWCEHNGVKVSRGIATVYKAVSDTFRSSHGADYSPGLTPVADDWDGGDAECGGGLHFSPTPAGAKAFDGDATRFVACQVRLADMRAPKETDQFPDKIKAKGCCKPCVEVDIYGKPVAAE